MKHVSAVCAFLLVACAHKREPASTAPSTAEGDRAAIGVMMNSYPMGDGRPATSSDMTLDNFVAAVPPNDSGGECKVVRPPASKVTYATAYFPSFASASNRVSLTFDSTGALVRFADHRGQLPERVAADTAMSRSQRDSAFRVAMQNTRQTMIQLDFPIDRGTALNIGGSGPNLGAGGPIRMMLNSERLGAPLKRIARVRKLCDV